jgi:hypothetical protein
MLSVVGNFDSLPPPFIRTHLCFITATPGGCNTGKSWLGA